MFYYTHLSDDRVGGLEDDDSLSAAHRLAWRFELPVETRFTVVSGVTEPDTIKLPPSVWEALVEIVATEFKSDAAYMAVMKNPVDLSKWHAGHQHVIAELEASLNDLFRLGQTGEGTVKETFEVIAVTPKYIAARVND